MPVVNCPIEDCTYATPDVEAVVIAALLTTHATIHNTQYNANSQRAAVEKVKRPTVSSAGNSEDWTYFQSRWKEYVEATQVTGKDRILQLLECCDEQLRKDLSRSTTGSLTSKTEEEVLTFMRTLAVREENIMVARATLNSMKQDRDEAIRSFGARLRGQAAVCKYITQCPHCEEEVTYTDCILRDVLIQGIEDPEIQLELLGNSNQDMPLEEVFSFIEAKEAGKRSASRLLQSQGAASSVSSYRRNKREALKRQETAPQANKNKTCSYCGRKGHGQYANANDRKKDCPAYGHMCRHCSREHHFESVCRSKMKADNNDNDGNTTAEGAIFDLLCTISTTIHQGRKTIALDHHVYRQLSDSWVKQASKPQPFVKLNLEIAPEDYNQLGFSSYLSRSIKERFSQPKSISVSAMADTGCQSCLTGIKVIYRLGLKDKDLIPVRMKMHAANNQGINILGAVILRISGRDSHGKVIETHQITYVTDNSDKLFISKEACISLGMIPESFPTIGEVRGSMTNSAADSKEPNHQSTQNISQECSCPKRTLPPPLPKDIPYPPIEENREKLKQWILDYYKSSTFNTCEHQPLPHMEGPPLKLMIIPNSEPVAFHTPIPVLTGGIILKVQDIYAGGWSKIWSKI